VKPGRKRTVVRNVLIISLMVTVGAALRSRYDWLNTLLGTMVICLIPSVLILAYTADPSEYTIGDI
jgi:hypothetical protein